MTRTPKYILRFTAVCLILFGVWCAALAFANARLWRFDQASAIATGCAVAFVGGGLFCLKWTYDGR